MTNNDDTAPVADKPDPLTAMFGDRSGWDARRAVARAFVEQERNWSSNIVRYEPIYQRLVQAASLDVSCLPTPAKV